ncbi:MAG: hypothetical protein LBR80_03600 [Deltaproteobacteria bacterium]|jgi:hypothetical protein|nr:hypothetical protein [Deltaproteobacteria bacterium]
MDVFQEYWHENFQIHISQDSLGSVIQMSISDILSQIVTPDALKSSEKLASEAMPYLAKSITKLINEAFCLLVLLAFLQRTLNGGADYVDREVAAGRGMVDICIGYKGRRYLLELKIKGNMSSEDGVGQLIGYMEILHATEDEGRLVVFDRDIPKSSKTLIPVRIRIVNGKIIHVVAC